MSSFHNSRLRLRCLGFVAAIVFAALPASARGQDATGSGTVTGRVTDGGAPAAGVEVVALRAGRTIARSVSDGTGRYSFTVSAGSVRVSIDGGISWQAVEGSERTVAPGETLVVDLAIEPMVHVYDEIVVSVDGSATSLDDVIGMVDVVHPEQIRSHAGVNAVDAVRSRAGVDLVDTGLSGRVLTFRGFNNIFSGALRMLVDHRKASIPSLRANFSHFLPTGGSDMERMELILGPSSGLYGPNSANGVVNILTRSPLELPESFVSISGGSQSVFQSEVRSAQRLGERLGVKLSARWFQGEEFPYVDPAETMIRGVVDNDPDTFRDRLRDIGVPESEIAIREARVGIRDEHIERWSGDVRVDWTPSDGDTLFFQGGRATSSGIELTPLGAAQADHWRYDYLQARLQSGPLFAQAYVNQSGAGDTYLLRDGATLVDRSRVVAGQLRHTFALAGDREEITWGGDWTRTTPRTGGTIHGEFEDVDEITEYGAYVQSRTRIGNPLQLVATVRYDESNVIEDPVISPRVGLVLQPAQGHTFTASWARGFSTPTPTNYFLDLSAGAAPGDLGTLGYRVRARGTGRDGIRFSDGSGGYQGMRSPLTPDVLGGPSALLPATSTVMWPFAVAFLESQGAIDAATAAYLRSLDPGGAVGLNAIDPVRGTVAALAPGTIDDVAPVAETTTTTTEIGYRGRLGGRVSVQAAAWRTRRENFTSPLLLSTPLLALDGPQLAAFLTANGLSAAQAGAIATGVAPIPFGVLSSEDITGRGAEVVATYANYGSITYWGFDLAAQASLSRLLTLSAATSRISDDVFRVDGRRVPLNAPEAKGTIALSAGHPSVPLSGEVRLRLHSGFPVASADYVGTACLGESGPLVEECVASSSLLDLSMGYSGLMDGDLALRVAVTNALDEEYRGFVGVPTIGRQLVTKLEYRLR